MEINVNKPELLYTSRGGGTIHSYELTGGKTVYERFLTCYLGYCEFFNDMDEAKKALKF